MVAGSVQVVSTAETAKMQALQLLMAARCSPQLKYRLRTGQYMPVESAMQCTPAQSGLGSPNSYSV